jgi:hypothetical protein
MSAATEARTAGSTPVPASPARASPESLSRTRLREGVGEWVGGSWFLFFF